MGISAARASQARLSIRRRYLAGTKLAVWCCSFITMKGLIMPIDAKGSL